MTQRRYITKTEIYYDCLLPVVLPSHRVTELAAEEIPPSSFAAYWGDSDTLLTYAQGVTQTLLSGVLQPAQAETMKGLLHDLVRVMRAFINNISPMEVL